MCTRARGGKDKGSALGEGGGNGVRALTSGGWWWGGQPPVVVVVVGGG